MNSPEILTAVQHSSYNQQLEAKQRTAEDIASLVMWHYDGLLEAAPKGNLIPMLSRTLNVPFNAIYNALDHSRQAGDITYTIGEYLDPQCIEKRIVKISTIFNEVDES